MMREHRVTLPELALIGGTRAMLGFGLGLLLGDRFRTAQRKAVGVTLVVIGALSTVPLAFVVRGRTNNQPARASGGSRVATMSE